MNNVIRTTSLVGDIRFADMNVEPEIAQKFVIDLEFLMKKYQITKLDICWNPFAVQANRPEIPVHISFN